MTEFEPQISGLEATTLPTEPQPLPKRVNYYYIQDDLYKILNQHAFRCNGFNCLVVDKLLKNRFVISNL